MALEIVNGMAAAVMVVCAVIDIKKKELSFKWFVLLGIFALAGCMSGQRKEVVMTAAGILPGVFLLILARITEQSIGYGDGILLAELGLLTGIGRCMLILSAALAMAGVFSLGMIVIKKVDRRYKIPFVPFLTIAYLAGCFGR